MFAAKTCQNDISAPTRHICCSPRRDVDQNCCRQDQSLEWQACRVHDVVRIRAYSSSTSEAALVLGTDEDGGAKQDAAVPTLGDATRLFGASGGPNKRGLCHSNVSSVGSRHRPLPVQPPWPCPTATRTIYLAHFICLCFRATQRCRCHCPLARRARTASWLRSLGRRSAKSRS